MFAVTPVDEVTVQDIAVAVGMTPAAVYYHFASKEQILLEGMKRFRDELLDEMRSANVDAGADIGSLVQHILGWAARRRTNATVYFVSSIGLNLTVEALRRETRVTMVELLTGILRRGRGVRRSEAGVIAVGLVSLLETALASMLNQDVSHSGIGSRRFATEAAAIARRIVGQ